MKLALISPKGALTNNKKLLRIWNESPEARAYRDSLSGLSTGLLTIAALTPKCFDIEFIDENHENIDFNKNYDLVGITGMTQQATRAYEIADRFRKKNILVVLGGIHATLMPQEAEQHADAIVIGEGEDVWPLLIKDFLSKNLKKKYRANSFVDMNKTPIPEFNLIDPKHYKAVWLQTTRGCPRDCEFCTTTKIYGPKCRHKPIKNVIKEIKYVKKICKQFQLGFADDNMFLDRKYAKELISHIKGLNVRWFAQTDISIAEDVKFLELLRQSNCMTLFIGFESISKNALNGVDKYGWKLKQLEKYPQAIRKIQSYGIGIVGAFIVGLDGDDSEVFNKLADFIIRNNIYAAQITVPTPLPGTRLRERIIEEGRLLSAPWSKYTFTDVNLIPRNMTPLELEKGLEMTYAKVYNNREVNIEKRKHFKKIYYSLVK